MWYSQVGLSQYRTLQPRCTYVFFFKLSNLLHFLSSAGHGRKTGTNLHAALYRVSEVISFFKQNRAKNHFNETQNIIIIETDGKDTGNVAQTMKETLIFRVKEFIPSLCLSACRLLQHRDQASDCPGPDPESAGLPQQIPRSHRWDNAGYHDKKI